MLLVTLLAALAAAAPNDVGEVVHRSAHYQLTWRPEGEGAEDFLRLAEALHAQLEGHFEAAPPASAPLEVVFCRDHDDYAAVLQAEGAHPAMADAGGVYLPATRRAYFWPQPSWSFTRHLFLHELVHQFHYLAVMDNEPRCPGWYAEGIAEHFAWHTWDGEVLRTGLSDIVGLEENIPSMATAAADGSLDLLAVLEGRAGAPKPEAWAATHWLLASPDAALRARFRAAERRLWRGEALDLAKLLGPRADERAAALDAGRAFLAGLETTWKIEWTAWDTRGATLVGESGVVALVRARDDARRGGLACTATAPGRAAIVLGFRGTDAFLLAQHEPGGSLRLLARADGAWSTLASANAPTGVTRRLAARVETSGVVHLVVDGVERLVTTVDAALLAGPPGLACDGVRAEFSDVEFLP
ncbi:MAG: hypothetical protein H6828_06870 [Planctomycetes bacterium]|nr:hypothetical protein [Planctomycetota bacterium]